MNLVISTRIITHLKKSFIVVVLILSGCLTDREEMLSKPSRKKPYPGMMTRPSEDNRRAIMSGEQPNWETDERYGIRLKDW